MLTDPDCDSEKAIIYTLSGVSEINAILDASGFELQSYQTFKECFEDIIAGNRDPSQVPPETVEEYKEMYEDEKY